MNRYCVRFSTADDTVRPEDLKPAVEEVLLDLHPRFTFRMGRSASIDPGRLTVEIESEAKKNVLLENLRPIERKLPVVLQAVDWGWEADDRPDSASSAGALDWGRDPLARVEPLPVPVVFLPVNNRLVYRYVLFGVLTLALLLFFIIRYALGRSFVSDLIWLGFYSVWFFSLNEIPIDIRLLLEKIECAPEGLELTYRFPKNTVRLPWEDILDLEAGFAACAIRAEQKPIRFLATEKAGFKQKDLILKTIIHRASLRFVEGNLLRSVYRRGDAP
jgi:hypothetical protein